MKTLRRLRAHAATQAPRVLRRREFDTSDADSDGGPPPEVVFDRITGPFGSRYVPGSHIRDEDT